MSTASQPSATATVSRRRLSSAGPDTSVPDMVEGDAGATASGPSMPMLWRRYRIPLLAVLAGLLVAVGIGVVSRHGVRGELDPRAVDGEGSRALATLLGDRGVQVRRITTPAEVSGAATERDVVLVAFPDLLPAAGLRQLAAASVGRLVLVAPGAEALSAATDDAQVVGVGPVAPREPGCGEEAATAAGVVELGGTTYRITGGGTACYRVADGSSLVLARTRSGSELAVLGAGDPLTNARLAEQGNAALALNLLGADGSADRVLWLVPVPGAAAGGDDGLSISDIVPPWARPAALQLLVAALLAALWRARRLGPPVIEPLPVVVRAAETVEGRARLYRRAQARDRAAEALRAGALARLVPRLGLDPAAGGEPKAAAVVEAVAERSGLPAADVQEGLYGPPPPADSSLVRLADFLDTIVRSTLDSEVRRS